MPAKQHAPWWLSLALAGMSIFQQCTMQRNNARESTNDQAIHALIAGLTECLKNQP